MSENAQICELIFELRYKPNPKLLDYRGTLANNLTTLLSVSEWQTTDNRVDVHDKELNIHAFVSFKNTGMVIRTPPTKNYFQDQVLKLMRYLFKQVEFGDKVLTSRMGIRYRIATEYTGDFQDLLKLYINKYAPISDTVLGYYGGSIVDIGTPFEIKTPHGTIKSNSGPVQKEQLENFFRGFTDIPEVALYFDLDYWVKPAKRTKLQ